MKKTSKLIVAFVSILFLCSVVVALLFGLNTFGVVRILQTPITLKIENYYKVYDGEPVTDLEFEVTNGSLVMGDYVEVSTFREVKDAGVYEDVYTYTIYNRNGVDVTSSYNVTEDFGEIRIDTRDITVTTGTDVFLYEPGKKYKLEVIDTVGIVLRHHVEGNNFREVSSIGIFDNTCDVKIIDENGEDVIKNYNVLYNWGKLIVANENLSTDNRPTPPGQGGDEGEEPENPDEEKPGDETQENEEFEEKVEVEGEASAPSDVTESEDVAKFGDRENSLEPVLSYTPSKPGQAFLVTGYQGNYVKNGWTKAPIYTPKYGANPQEFVSELIKNSANEIEGEMKYLSIKKRDRDFYAVYPNLDELAENDLNVVLSDLQTDTIHIKGYDFDYMRDQNFLKNVSFSDNSFINEEASYRTYVYENYTKIPDTTKKVIDSVIQENNLKGDSLEDTVNNMTSFFKENFHYDNKDLACVDAEDVIVDFLTNNREGHCYMFSSSGALILRDLGYPTRIINGYIASGLTPGKEYLLNGYNSHAMCQVYLDGKGWVSLEFTVAPLSDDCVIPPPLTPEDSDKEDDSGTPEEEKKPEITIATSDISKVYDGKPLIANNDDYQITGDLNEGDQIVIFNNSTIYDVGMITNEPSYLILDANFNDVTDNYKVIEDYGSLIISPFEITIESSNQAKAYDGTSLVTDYKCSSLLPGDQISEVMVSSITEKGETLAYVSIKEIINEDGKNVLNNYSINYIYGYLRIY